MTDPAARWKSRIVGHANVPPTELVAHPMNPRRHPKTQRDALAAVLDDLGWLSEVLVNETTGHVIDGHARIEEAIARGEPTVPVTVLRLSRDEELRALATYDQVGAMATIDTTALDALLQEISTDDPAIVSLLDTVARGAGLAFVRAGLSDPDEVMPVPSDAALYVAPGDLWALGEQRLLCGNATCPADVARLLAGATPALLVTDPPYGVRLDPRWRDGVYNALAPAARPYMQAETAPARPSARRSPARRQGRSLGYRNTSMSGDTRADWSEAFALVPSLEVAYVWHATSGLLVVGQGLERIGFELRQQVVWVKTLPVIGRSAYNWAHEPCWYAVRTGKTASWLGDHRDSTVWEFASPKMIMGGSEEEKLDHPAQKPCECMARPIRHHPGDVYDPFVGSGTTLIAAEQLGRRAYAMEIDPRYCQITIERWQRFTGRQAERVEGPGEEAHHARA